LWARGELNKLNAFEAYSTFSRRVFTKERIEMSVMNRILGHALREATFRGVLVAMCCLGVLSSPAWSQKKSGGSSSTSMPPVTIVLEASSFEYRPDLGGVYDRTRGIVWGYSLTGINNSGSSYNFAMSLGSTYAAVMDKAGDDAEAEYYYLLATYGIADPARLVAAEALWAAAAVASQYTNWRPPTLTEARDATSRGLFTYGASGLNMWTGSPADTVFGLPYDGRSTWTSDKGKGKDVAWTFNPKDGSGWLIGMGSSVDAIMVRSYTGP